MHNETAATVEATPASAGREYGRLAKGTRGSLLDMRFVRAELTRLRSSRPAESGDALRVPEASPAHLARGRP